MVSAVPPVGASGFPGMGRYPHRGLNFRFHDLRHTFATRVRDRGAPLDVVARLLGHQPLAAAQRYAHVADSELRASLP